MQATVFKGHEAEGPTIAGEDEETVLSTIRVWGPSLAPWVNGILSYECMQYDNI